MAQGSSNPTSNLQKVAGTAVDTNTGNASAGTQRVVLATNQPTLPVSGTFWQTTQPVSIAAMPSTTVTNAGTFAVQAAQSGTWNIGTVTNLSQLGGTAVSMNTGVRDAGTQRVTIATNDSVPVTGTFWQATQPVSGTFWQATQPVSIATMPSTPVTGTFWQATQPVSIATMPSTPVTNTGTFAVQAAQSGTWTVQPGNTANTTPWLTKGYGAVTTAAPTYTTGTDNPLSLTTSGALRVDGSGVTQPVSGTFWQATQPVSGTVSINSIPAGTNAIGSITNTTFASTQSGTWNIATVTNLSQLGGTAISMNTGVRDAGTQRVTIATNDSVPVTGTFWQATQPVSAASLPLPSGASTSAKQPALGTAGTASTDVLTVQGIAGAVAIPVSLSTLPALATGSNAIGSITNTSFAVTQATAANLNATVTGTVELGATSLAALENISVTIPGTVDLGTVSLTALETITVTSSTPGNFQSKVYGAVTTSAPAYTNATDNALSLTTSGALRVDGSAATQPVSGTVSINAIPAGTNAIGSITNTSFAATQSGTWNIGTVTNLSQLGGTAISMNTGVRDAGTQRVTIATNDSVPVTGTFWQTTQPVSIATMPSTPVTGTFWQATQPVSLASVPSHPVTNAGTFAVQAAQSGTWTVQPGNTANTTPWLTKGYGAVTTAAPAYTTGTDNALSLTTSGALRVDGSGVTQPVSGTFWQATQPVSIATMPSTPVTGTFWQATQPVSIASAVAITDNAGSLTVDAPVATPVFVRLSNGTSAVDTLPVSGTVSINAIPTGSNAIGSITNTSFASTQSGTWTVQPGNTANTTPWLIKISDGTNSPAIKAASTLAAATDPALVVAVRDSIAVTGTFYQATQPVSGTVAATQSGTWNIGTVTNLSQLGGTAISMNTGVRDAGTQRVTIATNDSVPVTGTFWQTTQPVSLASVPSHPVTNAGTFAVQAAQSGTWTVQPGNTANTTPWLVKPVESLGTATVLGALNAEITQALNGNLGAAAVITATATPVGVVLTPYTSYDGGTNWTITQFFNSTNGDAISTLSTFAVGDAYSISSGDGATHVKVRATSWTSGSVTVRLSSTNSQGLVNLKSTAVHDDPAGSFIQQVGAVASSTAPTAVSANGDAVRLWATTSGALNIADGGGSITVDGTFWQTTQPVSGTVAATQSGTWNIGTVTNLSQLGGTAISMNTGVRDAGTQRVTIATNDSVPVTGTFWQATQPVSGTVAATQSGTWNIATVTNLSQLGGTAISMNTGVRDAGTQRVTIATNDSVPVTGTFWQATQPVSGTVAATQSGTWTVQPGNTANTTPWLIRPSDGTNSVAIKAASTAAVAADPALVVAISPNNSVAVTGTFWQTTQPVSGTVAATQSGTWNIGTVTNLSQLGGTAISMNTGVRDAGTQRVTIATNDSVPVTGTFWQTTQPVSGTVSINSIPAGANAIGSITNTSFAVTQATASSLQATATQALGTAATRWYTQISDGTNSPAIKSSGNGALTTDPALVVAISPNNTVAVVGLQISNATTTAYSSSLIIKALGGTIFTLNGYNSKTSGQFIQLHNSATVPADTAVPVVTFYVPASSNFSFDWGMYGRTFTTGIVVTNSSTGATKTIGAADCWFDVTYR